MSPKNRISARICPPAGGGAPRPLKTLWFWDLWNCRNPLPALLLRGFTSTQIPTAPECPPNIELRRAFTPPLEAPPTDLQKPFGSGPLALPRTLACLNKVHCDQPPKCYDSFAHSTLVLRGFTSRKRWFDVIYLPKQLFFRGITETVDFAWFDLPDTLVLRGFTFRKRWFHAIDLPKTLISCRFTLPETLVLRDSPPEYVGFT
jgi:hypothetical protein